MIRAATESDAEALVQLINRAFLVERFFLDGDRIDLEGVRRFLKQGLFLVEEEASQLDACIYVEVRGERGYFGLLSVEPSSQGKGLGRRLIVAAENHCRAAACKFMDLQIVNVREDLPAFYQKLGYKKNGTAPFPTEVVTKMPCHFVKMSKPI
jgi:GNAT superfamily N-acetyltransferase